MILAQPSEEVAKVLFEGTHLMEGDQTPDPRVETHSMAEDQTRVIGEVVQVVQIMVE